MIGRYAVLAAGLALMSAAPAAAESNPAPAVVPALREWSGGSGALRLHPHTPIAADRALRGEAETLADDLEALTGRRPPVAVGAGRKGGIRLTLAGAQERLGDEGYGLEISDRVTVRANTGAGAFNGTRTVLQLLKLDPAHRSVPRGSAADWPGYRERGIMLDAGRKYWQVEYLEDLIRQMAWHKLNVLHWHLSEWNAFRLESDRFPGLAADQAYSKADVRRIQDLARRYHVTILPEIDLPGHATAILEYDPSMRFDCPAMRDGWTIDITKQRTRDFVRELLGEFLPLFDGPRFHLGTDEYETQAVQEQCPELVDYAAAHGLDSTADVFVEFINEIDEFVRAHGKRMEIWNWWDVDQRPTTTPNEDIVVSAWTGSPEPYLDMGYDVVSTPADLLYLTPTAPPGAALWPDAQTLYDSWAPQRRDNLLGFKISVWADGAETAPDGYFEWSLRRPREVVADRLWGGPRIGGFWAFQDRVDALGAAPGVPEVAPRGQVALAGEPYGSDPGFEAVYDGDPQTFFDAARADGAYAGIDLGADRSARVTAIRFAPRDNSQQNLRRMVGGAFQGCTQGPDSGCVDLFTVRWRPSHVWHEVAVDVPLRFRWLRYVGPPGGFGNVAEVQFLSDAAPRSGGPPNPAWLDIRLEAPDTAQPGTTLHAEVTVANVGGRAARGGELTLRLDGATATADIGDIAPGGSATVPLSLALPDDAALGDHELTAEVRLGEERFEATRGVRVSRWSLRYVDSEETAAEDGRAVNAFDGDPATYWHTEWSARTAPLPHEIQVDLLADYELTGFRYLPRAPNVNGMIRDYELYVSADGEQWGEPVARGAFPHSFAEQRVTFPATRGRYIRLVALSEQLGRQWTNVAELNIEGRKLG